MGWCQKNKNSDDGLLQEWVVKKPLCCSSWICSSEQREAPRSMPKATAQQDIQAQRACPRGILLGLLTARSVRLVLKPSREHSNTSGCSPWLSISQSKHLCVAQQFQSRWEAWPQGAQPCCWFGPKRDFQQEFGAITVNDVATCFVHELDQSPCWPSHCLCRGQAFQHLCHLQIWSSPQGYKN